MPGRRCRSSAPSRRRSRPARRASARSRAPARTRSASTGPTSASCSAATATTAASAPTTSTASTSTSAPTLRTRSSTASSAGRADWGYTLPGVALQPRLGLIAKFALNHSRFFLDPGLTVSMYVLNSSGPLFRNNPKLRRAVNLALDRAQLVRPPGIGAATDQYLAADRPGLQAAHDLPGSRHRPRASAGGRKSPRR